MERKLAAIMAGDIVGYSLLMAEKEASTYADLRTVFDDLIDPTIGRHGGRTFKTTGDGFLASFRASTRRSTLPSPSSKVLTKGRSSCA